MLDGERAWPVPSLGFREGARRRPLRYLSSAPVAVVRALSLHG